MSAHVVTTIGIDPGPVPGFVILRCAPTGIRSQVVQCTSGLAPAVFETLLAVAQRADGGKAQVIVQLERFVVGRRASRSSTATAGEATRDLIGALHEVWHSADSTPAGRLGGRWFQRAAGNVKPWAVDERLDAAGLLEATKGMKHARDAARHALFAACHDGGIPDPLSNRAKEYIR